MLFFRSYFFKGSETDLNKLVQKQLALNSTRVTLESSQPIMLGTRSTTVRLSGFRNALIISQFTKILPVFWQYLYVSITPAFLPFFFFISFFFFFSNFVQCVSYTHTHTIFQYISHNMLSLSLVYFTNVQ